MWKVWNGYSHSLKSYGILKITKHPDKARRCKARQDKPRRGGTQTRRCPVVLKNTVMLTHWGRVTHICVGKLIIIGSDNGLSPDRRQAIIWTNAGLLLIGPLQTYFNENLIKMQQFSLKKMHVKMSSAKWRPSCLGLNVFITSRNS